MRHVLEMAARGRQCPASVPALAGRLQSPSQSPPRDPAQPPEAIHMSTGRFMSTMCSSITDNMTKSISKAATWEGLPTNCVHS
jgi:hypothetical protein